jgi:hypothetical protein
MEGRDEKGRFAKGNLFSLGNTGGRPPKYDDPAVMEKKIAEYLDWEDSQKRPDSYSGQGKGIYTIEGCALFLGFASVQSMYDYEKVSSEFSYVINRFRLFVTQWNAQKLYWGGTMAGAQFWLKNWGGYKDESTQHQKTEITEIKIVEKKRDEG